MVKAAGAAALLVALLACGSGQGSAPGDAGAPDPTVTWDGTGAPGGSGPTGGDGTPPSPPEAGATCSTPCQLECVAGACAPLACESLDAVGPAGQVAILEALPGCAPGFVELLSTDPARHLEALYAGVASPAATDRLFLATYEALRADRLRFERSVVEELHARLPGAVAACAGADRCDDWGAFVVDALHRGRLFACPDPAGRDAVALAELVPFADYACAEAIAAAAAPVADDALVTRLLELAELEPLPWARRNALRVLGRLAEQPAGHPGHLLVAVARGEDVRRVALDRLAVEAAEEVLADAIWLLDAFFHPTFEMQLRLEALAADPAQPSHLRFRAFAAAGRLLGARAAWSDADVDLLVRSLSSDDRWIRAEAAFRCELVRDEQLGEAQRDALTTALHAAYAGESDLVPRAFVARALDRLEGTALHAELRAAWEADRLPRTVPGTDLALRSALRADELESLRDLLAAEASAFLDLLGPPFDELVAGDPGGAVTVVILATPAEYADYMGAFVGSGAGAGGLFLEETGTIYTYARTASESEFTLGELLAHEYAHALQARHVYPGRWGDAGYHAEPRGWADEGLAELLAGAAYGAEGGLELPLREVHLATLCAAPPQPLRQLLRQRAGYDQPGTFDYAGAWAFARFLHRSAPEARRRLFLSFRDGSYRVEDFAAIAGVESVEALDAAWRAAVDTWCAPPW